MSVRPVVHCHPPQGRRRTLGQAFTPLHQGWGLSCAHVSCPLHRQEQMEAHLGRQLAGQYIQRNMLSSQLGSQSGAQCCLGGPLPWLFILCIAAGLGCSSVCQALHTHSGGDGPSPKLLTVLAPSF